MTDTKKSLISEGSNPDFGLIQIMHSHRAKVFNTLTMFLFLDEYCRYYMLTNQSKVNYY